MLVTAYPRRALELIKYQQIISRAVTKFKGLAWVSYDQQFRRRAAYDLSLSWDKVDLELWTVTFAGLAKPHCNVFVRAHTTLKMSVHLPTPTENCVDPRQCASTSTSQPAADAVTAATRTYAAAAIPVPTSSPTAPSNSPATPARFLSLATEARSKVNQLRRHQKPFVSSPIDIYRLNLELADHPDRDFVFNLLTTLKEGARIGYSGPRSVRVSPNLISAAQHPDVVSLNLQK